MPKSSVKASELREKTTKDMQAKLADLREELSVLRVAQVTKAAASKLSKIKEVRKNIARVLTVINQRAMEMYRKEAKKEHLQRVPVYMRAKKTRAIRRALTPKQKSLETERTAKKRLNFPVRKFALKA